MTSPLELRLQRLLRAYPVAYRRAHGADMLGTMLADASPGQRWPRPGDAANMIFHAVRLRLLRRPGGGLFDAGWAEACALLGPLAALGLLATALPGLLRMPPAVVVPPFDVTTFNGFAVLALELQVAGWACATLAALTRLRRTAAVFGWVALLMEVAPLPHYFEIVPVSVIEGLWRPALGFVAAVALTVAGLRRVTAVFGRWRLVALLAAAAVIDVIATMSGEGIVEAAGSGGSFYVFDVNDVLGIANTSRFSITASSPAVLYLELLCVGVSLLASAIAVFTVPGRIRRRLLAAVAPVVALRVLVDRGFGGWAASNYHMGHSIPLVPMQWIALIGVPVLTFAVGLWWVRRRDELLRLAALGAAAGRPEPSGDDGVTQTG